MTTKHLIGNKRAVKHGKYNSPAYNSWIAMKTRCNNQNHKHWVDYGGRGISVCERWINSFENFLTDMGERPESHELDRIDCNGNYERDNCRWVISKVNCRNRRSNNLLTFNNQTLTVMEWSEKTGIKRSTINERLRRNWPIDQVLTKATRGNGGINGHVMSCLS